MTVAEACESEWDKTPNLCNVYAAAVAAKLYVLLPGGSSEANFVTRLVSDWATFGPMMAIPPGGMAASRAIQFANAGHFVLAAATSAEINAARIDGSTTSHGHLAIVTPGIGNGGWPRGYWKSMHGTPGRNQSLSRAFRHRLMPKIHYFVVLRADTSRGRSASPLSLL
jgi:hypothetical protein